VTWRFLFCEQVEVIRPDVRSTLAPCLPWETRIFSYQKRPLEREKYSYINGINLSFAAGGLRVSTGGFFGHSRQGHFLQYRDPSSP
jgi:hypothetical protein